MPVPQAVAALAVPTVLSSLVMIAYNLADTYFIGMLGDPVQNAGVTLAAPLLLAFNAVNNLFGVGSSSMMSRALGQHDAKTVAQSSAFGFYGALFMSILFSLGCLAFKDPLLALLGANAVTAAATAAYIKWTVIFGAVPAIVSVVLSYLMRAEGSALLASAGTISGCLLNIVLDPIFALPWGLSMGVAGVALATFLSNCVACLYFLILLRVRRGKTAISISPRYIRPPRQVVSGVLSVGLSAAIQNLLNVTGMTVLNNFTAGYGTTAVAAMGITQKIDQVPIYILMGISQGVSPLISYTYAARRIPRMHRTITFSTAITLVTSLCCTAAFLIWAHPLTGLFIQNAEVVDCGAGLLTGFCLGLPFLCLDFMAVGVFQALDMGRHALVFAIVRKIILEIPALFILNQCFGLYGLAYAQLTAECVLGTAAVLLLLRLSRRLDTLTAGQ